MTKKIFITGGAGFIGSAIVKKLQEQGHSLFIFDDLSFGSRKFVNICDAQFAKENILDGNVLKKALIKFSPDIVIHLAAIHFIPYCNEHPFDSANINILGTANVLNACKELPNLEKILFASTAAVYPVYDGAIHETLDPKPSDIYGLSKFAGEELCKKFFLETQVPTIICRFFNAFGPNETNPHLIPAILDQVISGSSIIKIGNTVPKRDYIHTSDMANAVTLLIQKFNAGLDTFNLGQGMEYSVIEVIQAFEKVLERPLQMETDMLRVRKTDRLHLLADITKIKNFTGWAPAVSLEEGIKTLIHEHC
ncbi:MAG TPA: NAD(P)-dependent oxidoreductase [Puia sp.]|nr:NAD(P)-dependent oxidoreductase [Puia sp.]